MRFSFFLECIKATFLPHPSIERDILKKNTCLTKIFRAKLAGMNFALTPSCKKYELIKSVLQNLDLK